MFRWLKTANPTLKYKYPEPPAGLPDPNKAASKAAAAECAAINSTIVDRLPEYRGQSPSRGPYATYTAEQRLQIAKYGVLHGYPRTATLLH